jgi:hypothetical protein
VVRVNGIGATGGVPYWQLPWRRVVTSQINTAFICAGAGCQTAVADLGVRGRPAGRWIYAGAIACPSAPAGSDGLAASCCCDLREGEGGIDGTLQESLYPMYSPPLHPVVAIVADGTSSFAPLDSIARYPTNE